MVVVTRTLGAVGDVVDVVDDAGPDPSTSAGGVTVAEVSPSPPVPQAAETAAVTTRRQTRASVLESLRMRPPTGCLERPEWAGLGMSAAEWHVLNDGGGRAQAVGVRRSQPSWTQPEPSAGTSVSSTTCHSVIWSAK